MHTVFDSLKRHIYGFSYWRKALFYVVCFCFASGLQGCTFSPPSFERIFTENIQHPDIRLQIAVLNAVPDTYKLSKKHASYWHSVLNSASMHVQLAGLHALSRIQNKPQYIQSWIVQAMGYHPEHIRSSFRVLQSFGKSALPALTKYIQSKRLYIRFMARKTLLQMGSLSVPYLLQLSRHPQAICRERAIQMLLDFSSTHMLPVRSLRMYILDPVERVQLMGLRLLQKQEHPRIQATLPSLMTLLSHSNIWIQQFATKLLISLGSVSLSRLRHTHTKQKTTASFFAAVALVHLGAQSQNIRHTIVQHLRHSKAMIRVQAIRAIRTFQKPSPGLLHALIQCFTDPAPTVAQAAAQTLASMGSYGFPYLRIALQSSSVRMQIYAAQTLRSMGKRARSMAPLLIRPLQHSKSLAPESWIHALGYLDAPSAYPVLLRLSGSTIDTIRAHAIVALAQMASTDDRLSKELQGVFKKALQASSRLVVRAAVRAVSLLKTKGIFALPYYVAWLQDPKKKSKREWLHAMSQMGPEGLSRILDLLLSARFTFSEQNAAIQYIGRSRYLDPSMLKTLIQLKNTYSKNTAFQFHWMQTLRRIIRSFRKQSASILITLYTTVPASQRRTIVDLVLRYALLHPRQNSILLRYMRRENTQTCILTARLLRALGNVTVDLVQRQYLKQNTFTQKLCWLRSIGAKHTSASVAQMAQKLKPQSIQQQKVWLRALRDLKTKTSIGIVNILYKYSVHSNLELRRTALRALAVQPSLQMQNSESSSKKQYSRVFK